MEIRTFFPSLSVTFRYSFAGEASLSAAFALDHQSKQLRYKNPKKHQSFQPIKEQICAVCTDSKICAVSVPNICAVFHQPSDTPWPGRPACRRPWPWTTSLSNFVTKTQRNIKLFSQSKSKSAQFVRLLKFAQFQSPTSAQFFTNLQVLLGGRGQLVSGLGLGPPVGDVLDPRLVHRPRRRREVDTLLLEK